MNSALQTSGIPLSGMDGEDAKGHRKLFLPIAPRTSLTSAQDCSTASTASSLGSAQSSPLSSRPRPQPLTVYACSNTTVTTQGLLSARSRVVSPLSPVSPTAYFTPMAQASPRAVLASAVRHEVPDPSHRQSQIAAQTPLDVGSWNAVGARLATCFNDISPTSSVATPCTGQMQQSPMHRYVLLQPSPVVHKGSPQLTPGTPQVQLKGGALVMHLLQAYQ